MSINIFLEYFRIFAPKLSPTNHWHNCTKLLFDCVNYRYFKHFLIFDFPINGVNNFRGSIIRGDAYLSTFSSQAEHFSLKLHTRTLTCCCTRSVIFNSTTIIYMQSYSTNVSKDPIHSLRLAKVSKSEDV